MKQYVNWKDLASRIPTTVEGPKGVIYEIVWSKDASQYHGQMIPDKNQIQLALGLSPKQTVEVFLHEIAHLYSDLSGMQLTESQVLLFEKFCIYWLLKDGNIFRKKDLNE